MPENRFYIDQPLQPATTVRLDPKESHHLMVMRKAVGEEVELINGKQLLAIARILALHKKGVELQIESISTAPKRKREMILCQALCDLSRLDLILQKTTELGVHEIWLFPSERSTKQEINAHQKERMEALLISAIKQCGRLDVPPLRIFSTLPPIDRLAFFGDVDAEAPRFLSCLKEERFLFFVGPPSGFSQKEIEALRQAGAKGVKLNDQILRAETAALCAVALAMH